MPKRGWMWTPKNEKKLPNKFALMENGQTIFVLDFIIPIQ